MKNPEGLYLFRGVNAEMHESGDGLKPKGTTFLRVLYHNGDFKFDGSITHGESYQNATAGHQYDSKKYPTSGISTSVHFEIAKLYATHKGQTGYVYVFDRKVLSANSIQEFIVNDLMVNPKKPEDAEVIIRNLDDTELPLCLVKKVIQVKPS